LAVGYLLLSAHLFDVIEDVQNIPQSPRSFFDLAREADTAHRNGLKIVADEGFGVEEPLEKHLSRSHGDLKQDNKADTH
jgi:hypothetical protein